MITNVIINDPSIYEDVTKDDESIKSEESEVEIDEDESIPYVDAGSNMSTASFLRTRRLFAQPTPSPSSTVVLKEIEEEFGLLTETLGRDIDGLLSSDSDTKIDALLHK